MAPTIFRCFPAPVTKTSNFIQNSRRDKNLITAAVLLSVNPTSAGYTIDIPKGTPQTNNNKQ
ncbi:MAG: hypothetical protein KH283_06160 [Collinsella sp.]|nr:hypothetical protein [Collinsella sp.]